MKNISILITSIIILTSLPLVSQDVEKKEILGLLEFPEPVFEFGKSINNPFFALDICKKNIDVSSLKKKIYTLEKDLDKNSNPGNFFELGNCYKELFLNEDAVKYYKKYLESSSSNFELNKKLLIRGEIFYILSDIDIKSERTGNLEKSLVFFNKAIELNPDDFSVWLKTGDCYLSLGRTSEALYSYNKAHEKNSGNFSLLARLQAASFQRDYSKLLKSSLKDKNTHITEGFNFDYIYSAMNNSPEDVKESIKLQHYIYLLRLLLIKNEINFKNNKNVSLELNSLYTNDEKKILTDADNFINTIKTKNLNPYIIAYISGIIKYLNSDYKKAVSCFEAISTDNKNYELIHDEILFINLYLLNNTDSVRKFIGDSVKINPDPSDYLILADLEFKNKNYGKALMNCTRALEVDHSCAEAYSAAAVIFTMEGNYIAADEMIRKSRVIIYRDKSKNDILFNQVIINEAAIALLNNEKERAYILLQSVKIDDNCKKVSSIYNRYFNKNEKIQN